MRTSLRGEYLKGTQSLLVATMACCGGGADMNNYGNLLDCMVLASFLEA